MKTTFFKPILRAILLAGIIGPIAAWAGVTDQYWQDTAQRSLPADAPQPANFRALALDNQQMSLYLKQAHSSGMAIEVSLPLPEGDFIDFTVVDSGTLPPELQAKYPDILSFRGHDANGRRIRLDMSSLGFQAMVFDPEGIWVVRPETVATGTNQYLSYRRAELQMPGAQWQCETHGDMPDLDKALRAPSAAEPKTITGVNQRVYRAAVAANNKYITKVGGGTVNGGLAATTVAINRVNELYGHEMSIQFTLVPNNDLIMFANAATDPFAGMDDIQVINAATGIINGKIGSSNYDIGHVFSTSGGGVAGLRVVCGGSKARGTTGLPNPIGDDFYIDFVAHEMGHQFGGNHPFNGSLGNCSGGNRNGSTAYEPGSGSSIMSYAGICSSDNLQPHSDPYFHAISLQEITTFTNGTGNCSVNTANPNLPPVIDPGSLPSSMTIPAQTPFALNAAATDPNSGDTLGYSWEQWDLGPQAPLSAGDNGSSPLFRSWPPMATGERVFPSLSTVLGGPAIKGEIVPTKTRSSMKFRLTVRDRSDDILGMGSSQSADIALAVTASAGPFKVNSPSAGVILSAGTIQSTSWDVANTTAAPVSCNSVDIDLSTDGGQNFTHSLATGVPNSGTASFAVPVVSSTQARLRVKCSNNVFFNVSPGNFTVAPGGEVYSVGGVVSGLTGSGLVLRINGGNDLPITADGAFQFTGGMLDGQSYAVTVASQPTNPYQACTVTNGTGTINEADVTDVQVTCVNLPSYSVGGTVAGLTNTGLKLKLNASEELQVPANATSFTFLYGLLNGSNYNVTISAQPLGQVCTIANNSGTISNADVTNVQLECEDLPPESHEVGGKVVNKNTSNMVLQLNGTENRTIKFNGTYKFTTTVITGEPYEVTILTQPTGQDCRIFNASGIMGYADVTNVDIDCAELPDEIFADGFEGDDDTGPTCSPTQLFADPSFEATDEASGTNPSWDGIDSLGELPFCDDSCDDDGTFVARTGNWFVWLGGWDVENDAYISQSVVFPVGQSRWLNYWMVNQVSGDPSASLTLKIDGNVVSTTWPETDGGAWTSGGIEIPAQYLDGQSHTVLFDFSSPSLDSEIAGAMFDDVTLDCQQNRSARSPLQSGSAPLRRQLRH